MIVYEAIGAWGNHTEHAEDYKNGIFRVGLYKSEESAEKAIEAYELFNLIYEIPYVDTNEDVEAFEKVDSEYIREVRNYSLIPDLDYTVRFFVDEVQILD